MPFPVIIYPCSSLLPSKRTLNRHQSRIRPEPLSPVATDQSLGPIYHNYLSHWCQMLPGFLPRLQADPSPWHERNYYTVKVHLSQSMNPRTIQVYVAAVSFLHHSLVYKSPASRNPMLRLAIQGLQRLQGAHSPQAYMTATDSGNAESHEAEINVAMIQPITTPTVYILVQPQQLPEWAFPLTPFKSLEDDKAQPTRHINPSSPDPPIRHQNYGYTPETISYSPTILVVFTWATPSGLLPWDSHQTMTSVLVWDTGRPNGDQRHPLVIIHGSQSEPKLLITTV
ncbi:hypothetical protein EMCRGX_G002078 [Ephydatia muelleri]